MRNIFTVGFLLQILACPLAAQTDTARTRFGIYFFDGDDVVFEFDRHAYADALRGADSASVDFADFPLLKIISEGNSGQWSQEGWTMQQLDVTRFRLRKPIQAFTDAPNWLFKFILNRIEQMAAETLKKEGVLGRYNTENPDKMPSVVSDTGNVLFKLNGFVWCKSVMLAGTFNNWNERELNMKRVSNGWELRLALKPGVYEYKFIADGQWMEDPANPEKRRNQYQTFNSVLYVTKMVRFDLKGYDDARTVVLSGSFNEWDKQALKMRRTENGWFAEVPLAGGKHLYKFIVDGNWMTDPANPRTETTWDGYVNSVLLVR